MELFSTAETPTAVEYGLRRLTPFTGSIYEGLDGVRKYFETIGELLSYEDMQFSDYVVDAEVLKVSVRGRATFTWQSTGKSWLETFTYTLEFDNLLNVKKYEVWADTGAAYLAEENCNDRCKYLHSRIGRYV